MRGSTGDILGGMATKTRLPAQRTRRPRYFKRPPAQHRRALGAHRKTGRRIIIDHLVGRAAKGFFLVPLFQPRPRRRGLADARASLTGIGLGDSGAHPARPATRASTFPARVLGAQAENCSASSARSGNSPSIPADVGPCTTAGLTAAGAYADVSVIDLDRLDITLPELQHRVPRRCAAPGWGSVGYDDDRSDEIHSVRSV